MAAVPEDQLDLRSLVGLTREEHVVHSADMPWIPYPGADGVFVKPLRPNRRSGVRAGTIVREPPGDIPRLIANDEGTVPLFILEGALLHIDENDNVAAHDDVLSHMRMYHEYCAEQATEPLDLNF